MVYLYFMQKKKISDNFFKLWYTTKEVLTLKAIIFSDSHRDFSSIFRAMEHEGSVDYIIHAGDVHKDVEDIEAYWRTTPCISVLGNNDFSVWGVPTRREFTLEGKKFFLTHGHLYGVKGSLAMLHREAVNCGADICIFGHTHRQVLEERNGIYFLNPGATPRHYAVIEMQEGTVDIQLKETPY